MNSGSDAEQNGFATIQYIASVAFSLTFLVLLVNLIVFQYGRGVVQAATDEAARAAAPVNANLNDCAARANEVLDDGLARSMRAGSRVTCTLQGVWVVAHGDADFPGWLPLVPDWHFTVTSRSLRGTAGAG